MKMHGPNDDEDRYLLALYEATKGSARIDFQDLLLLTTQMLREDPLWQTTVTDAIPVLIDEAQDPIRYRPDFSRSLSVRAHRVFRS